jgi:hypothetical protein
MFSHELRRMVVLMIVFAFVALLAGCGVRTHLEVPPGPIPAQAPTQARGQARDWNEHGHWNRTGCGRATSLRRSRGHCDPPRVGG